MDFPPSLPRLLIVDDEDMVRRLLCDFFEEQGYACRDCGNAAAALACLAESPVDLIISDLHMPGGSGLDLLRSVRRRFPEIAFVLASAAPEAEVTVEAMRAGASDFLLKPLDLMQTLDAIERVWACQREQHERRRLLSEAESRRTELEHLLNERTRQLGTALEQVRQASAETLQALAMALDIRARDVAGHSLRVSRYGVELAMQLGYDPSDLARFEYASYLHDIGKLGIPDAILNKPGALTADELTIMRTHVQIGFELVTQVQSLAPAADLVLTHQEHFDGGGYPRGLAGNDIPFDARIFAVADALDAMTSDRPYRRALSWQDARREIVDQSGRQFDPAVVAAFLRIPKERWLELAASAQPSLSSAALC